MKICTATNDTQKHNAGTRAAQPMRGIAKCGQAAVPTAKLSNKQWRVVLLLLIMHNKSNINKREREGNLYTRHTLAN